MRKIFRVLIVVLIALALLYPVFFVVVSSFMGDYVELLLDTPEFYIMFWNSVKVALFVVAGQLLVSIPAAWSFARYEFFGKRILFQLYILLMVLPFVVMMLPQYLVLRGLGLLDSLGAIIIPGIFSTFPVFLIQYYFRKIPVEMIETAKLDGANEWELFSKIGIPLAKPAIFTSIILNFIDYWGTMEQLMVFIDSKTHWTLPILITAIKSDNVSVTFVVSVFSMVSPVLLILYGKEDLEEGLA